MNFNLLNQINFSLARVLDDGKKQPKSSQCLKDRVGNFIAIKNNALASPRWNEKIIWFIMF